MKSEESVLTDFNLYFITFPRQVFVNIFDDKMQQFQRHKQTMLKALKEWVGNLFDCQPIAFST
jgi:hypothetical protein